ncbi:MAG: 50S ribosomal protein L10 [Patescibacteria group bacterium]
MAKNKQQKDEIVAELKDKLSRTKAMVFGNYYGLTVGEVETLRTSLRKNGGEFFVTKKTLLNVALKDSKIEGVNAKELPGGLGVAFGFTDEIAPAKVLAEFSKGHKTFVLSGGVLESKFIANDQVMALAKLPSRDELIAKVVGSIKSPISGFVGVMKGNLRNLVGVLNAIQEKKA